ncbi:MAG: hypothetical protein IPJ19_10335 [Planctomycetes bacterium]|nr:hypothetical protein [Planctomycetota bacterium]
MSESTKSKSRARANGPEDPLASLPGRRDALIAFAICVGLAFYWTLSLSDARAWGWDESMHAELPAVRILLYLKQGDVAGAHNALLDCSQYPFVWPLVLAGVQFFTGVSEHACRVAGTLAWCWALFGLFLLGRELGARIEPRLKGARWIAWVLLGFGALAPLALAYAGTLFLEVPFACMAVWALRAWVRRDGSATRELAAGEWITLALFTKWNYGLLLCGGLGIAWYLEGFAARRDLAKFMGRSVALGIVPMLACLWWFVLARGNEHFSVLLAFLKGNRGGPVHTLNERLMHSALFLHLGPVLLGCVLLLALFALVRLRSGPVRALFLVALALAVPSWLHPFHLDRFLVPQAIPLWALAAVGFGLCVWPLRLVFVALLGVGCAGHWREDFAARMGYLSESAATREYQRGIYASWRDLSGARALPTSGLERKAHDALLDAIAKEAGPTERVGWIGFSNELSPATLELGLLVRGGAPERFQSECTRMLDVTYEGVDPKWTDEQLAEWAKGFDLVLYATPPDMKDRAERRFEHEYALRLVALGWTAREIARALVSRPLQTPLEITLFACRKNP